MKQLLSIDMGSRSLALLQGSATPAGVEITRSAFLPLPEDTISDGIIKNPLEIVTRLRTCLDAGGFTANTAIVTVNSGNILLREFDVPFGKPAQVEGMVRNEMINTYSAGAGDVIEYRKLADTVVDGNKRIAVRAMALHRDIVSEYFKVLQEAKLRPLAMDAHPNALEKLLARNTLCNGIDMTGKSYLLLDFGFSGIMTYILNGRDIYTSRFVPLGMSDLASMLANKLLISSEQEKGDFAQLLDFGDESKQDSLLMETAGSFMVQCATEIQKIIMYTTSRLPQNQISSIFLCGGGALIPGLDQYFAKTFSADTQILTSLSAVSFKFPKPGDSLTRHLNAAGALIRLD